MDWETVSVKTNISSIDCFRFSILFGLMNVGVVEARPRRVVCRLEPV